MSKRRFPLEKIGLLLTAAYLLAGFALVAMHWEDFSDLEPNAWGDFLAGTFGPLALAWIVLGFFLQSRELQHSVDALRLQAEELKNSVEQQKAMVAVSNEQLSIELETRDRLKKQEEETLTPKISLLYEIQLGFGSTRIGYENFDFTVQNIGGPASSVRIVFDEKSISVGSLSTGEKRKLGTVSLRRSAVFDSVDADLRVQDMRGRTYNQKVKATRIG